MKLRELTEAAAAAVAREVGVLRREVQRERETFAAEMRAVRAEWEARLAGVAEVERRLADRLATLKDGRDGVDGRSVTVEELLPMTEEAIRRAVAAMPSPKEGPAGKDGRDGSDGKDGERGPEGPAGKLPVVTEWTDRVHREGEVVTRDGSVFQALRDTGKDPGHEDWRCIVERGRDGSDGRGFNVRETYSPDAEYRALDVVALNGAGFVARRDNPGPCPGDGWQMIAMQGRQGKPGPKGDRGERGPAGPALVAGEIDDQGMLTLTNGDGSTVPIDLYPVLSKVT